MRGLVRIAIALTLVGAAVALSGCSVEINGGGDSPSPSSQSSEVDSEAGRAELESQIRQQLPQQIEANLGVTSYVKRVGCTSSGATSYECIATISASNERGGLETRQIPIAGACDARLCTWHVEN